MDAAGAVDPDRDGVGAGVAERDGPGRRVCLLELLGAPSHNPPLVGVARYHRAARNARRIRCIGREEFETVQHTRAVIGAFHRHLPRPPPLKAQRTAREAAATWQRSQPPPRGPRLLPRSQNAIAGRNKSCGPRDAPGTISGSNASHNNSCESSNSYYCDRHGDTPILRRASGIEAWWRTGYFDLRHYAYRSLGEQPPAVSFPEPCTGCRLMRGEDVLARGAAGRWVGS